MVCARLNLVLDIELYLKSFLDLSHQALYVSCKNFIGEATNDQGLLDSLEAELCEF